MPRVELTRTKITRAGVAPPAEQNSDAVNNHYFADDGRTFLLVRNANVASKNVTIQIPGEVDSGIATSDRVVAVPGSSSVYIGPFTSVYWQPGTNQVYVDPELTTDLKFTVLYF